MSREMQFFMYLIEKYAEYKNSTAGDILTQWDDLGITNFIYDMYPLYSSEAIENAFADIDRLTAEKQQKNGGRNK